MRKLFLFGKHGNNKSAIVDDDVFLSVSSFRWYVDNKGYPYQEKTGRNRLFLHQFIMGEYPDGKSEIDHINGDKLDNRRENLRFCTSQENRNNRRKYKNNRSGVLGVQWHKLGKKWMARISRNQKPVYLGLFSTIEQAREAIEKAKG